MRSDLEDVERRKTVRVAMREGHGSLVRLAEHSEDWKIRVAAMLHLKDLAVLLRIVEQDSSPVQKAVIARLTDQVALARLARLHRLGWSVRKLAVLRLKDPRKLVSFARRDFDWQVRRAATSRLTDQVELAWIAEHDSQGEVRSSVVPRLTDQRSLARIAKHDALWYVRMLAVKVLQDQKVLAWVAEHDVDWQVREAAFLKNLRKEPKS